MGALEFIKNNLESDYSDCADLIMDRLEQRLSEAQPKQDWGELFENVFLETGSPFFICALVMKQEGYKDAITYVKGLWDAYYKNYIVC